MDDFPCLYRNISRRPIELHGDGAVVVLAAGATLRAEGPDPELSRLEQAGALSRHAAPPPSPTPSGEALPAAKSRSAKPRRAKPSAAKPANAKPSAAKPSAAKPAPAKPSTASRKPTASRPAKARADKGVP